MQQPVQGQRLKGEGAPCTPVPGKQLSTLNGPVDMPEGGIGTGLSSWLISCVTLGQSLSISGPQLYHL